VSNPHGLRIAFKCQSVINCGPQFSSHVTTELTMLYRALPENLIAVHSRNYL